MLHDITTMNSAPCVISHQSALTGVASSLNELTGFNSATEIDESLLNRERKARESLIQCFARQRSIWMRMQPKIDQARGGHPLLNLDGLENHCELYEETGMLSPESPDTPIPGIDFQKYKTRMFYYRSRDCARMLMKLNDYLRPFGEDVSNTTQSVAPTWSGITIELEDLYLDVRKLYKQVETQINMKLC